MTEDVLEMTEDVLEMTNLTMCFPVYRSCHLPVGLS